jgi:hypothetical protein
METNDRTENKKSTPVENKKADTKYHVNQSTEQKTGGNLGMIAIIVIIAIIVLGLLFFSDIFA